MGRKSLIRIVQSLPSGFVVKRKKAREGKRKLGSAWQRVFILSFRQGIGALISGADPDTQVRRGTECDQFILENLLFQR